jgi:hypothetical protein
MLIIEVDPDVPPDQPHFMLAWDHADGRLRDPPVARPGLRIPYAIHEDRSAGITFGQVQYRTGGFELGLGLLLAPVPTSQPDRPTPDEHRALLEVMAEDRGFRSVDAMGRAAAQYLAALYGPAVIGRVARTLAALEIPNVLTVSELFVQVWYEVAVEGKRPVADLEMVEQGWERVGVATLRHVAVPGIVVACTLASARCTRGLGAFRRRAELFADEIEHDETLAEVAAMLDGWTEGDPVPWAVGGQRFPFDATGLELPGLRRGDGGLN